MKLIKSAYDIECMRNAGRLAAECLQEMMKLLKPGVTPLTIDRACYEWTVSRGAIPAPLSEYRAWRSRRARVG